jgi:anti-anti-sigma regulatory factor
MSPSMPTIRSRFQPAREVVVSVAGDLDRAGIALLRSELAGWGEAGAARLWVDLTATGRCAPSLAAVLASVRRQLRRAGADLIITSGPGTRHAPAAAPRAASARQPVHWAPSRMPPHSTSPNQPPPNQPPPNQSPPEQAVAGQAVARPRPDTADQP